LIVALIGIRTIIAAESSFSDQFSSTLRLAYHASLVGGDVAPDDARGNDPLPDHLKKTMLTIPDVQPKSLRNDSVYEAVTHEDSDSSARLPANLVRRNHSGDDQTSPNA
jgi:hypothetical protein